MMFFKKRGRAIVLVGFLSGVTWMGRNSIHLLTNLTVMVDVVPFDQQPPTATLLQNAVVLAAGDDADDNNNNHQLLGTRLFVNDNQSEARIACHRLDNLAGVDRSTQVKNLRTLHNTTGAQLFEECLDSMERAQQELLSHQEQQQSWQPCASSPRELIHTAWMGPLKETAKLGITSFVMAYPPNCVKVILWTNIESLEGLKQSSMSTLPEFEFRLFDFTQLVNEIQFVHPTLNVSSLSTQNNNWTRLEENLVKLSDLIRLLALAAYGGIWLDVDVLLLRPLTPLLGHDFYYQWSFRPYCNTAVFGMQRASPNAYLILDRLLQITQGNVESMVNKLLPRFFHKFLTKDRTSIELLPSAYFDPTWLIFDSYRAEGGLVSQQRFGIRSYEDFFTANATLTTEHFFPGAFAFHWHNQWDKEHFVENGAAHVFRQAFAREAKRRGCLG